MFNKTLTKISTIAGILVFIAVVYFLSRHTHLITDTLTKSGPLAPLVAILLYPLLAPTPITTDPVTVIIGVSYGPFVGMIVAAIGNFLATIVEYMVAFKIDKRINFREQKKKLPFGLGRLSVNSVFLLLVGRMVPGYGSKVISFLAGAERVPLKKYLWTSALTSLLGAILLSYGGFELVRLIKSF